MNATKDMPLNILDINEFITDIDASPQNYRTFPWTAEDDVVKKSESIHGGGPQIRGFATFGNTGSNF